MGVLLNCEVNLFLAIIQVHAFQQFKYNAQLLLVYLGLAVIPAMTRSDAGTENGLLATCQMFLGRNCTDGLAGPQSHVYDTSM